MKVVILYHPKSDHGSDVERYAKEYQSFGYGSVDLVSLETRPGSDMTRLYDVVRYPSILAIKDTGELLKCWQDDNLPLMQEVAAYQRA